MPWLGSTAVHAVLLAGAMVLSMTARRESPQEPAPLIYIEPAPPPPLGGANDAANVQTARPPVATQQLADPEPRVDTPQPRLVIPQKQSKKQPEPARSEPKPVARALDQPKTPPAPAPAPAEHVAPNEQTHRTEQATEPNEQSQRDQAGEPGGVLGGTSGGKAGGVLGGHDEDVLSDAHVAEPPVVISRIIPQYPQRARARGIEGQVLLEVIVDREGQVEPDIKVLDSIPVFDEAAISALRQWRFRPGRDRNGRPARVVVRVPVRFRLR